MEQLKYMFKYDEFKNKFIFAFIEFSITSILWLIVSQFMTYSVFDNAIAKGSIKILVFVTILVIIQIILQVVEGIYHCRLRHHLQRKYSDCIRKDIYSKIINKEMLYLDNSHTGELLELITSDSRKGATFFTQNGIITTGSVVKIPVIIAVLMYLNYQLTLILLIIYIIGYGSIILSNRKTFKLILKIREINTEITKWINEQVNNFELIKSINLEENRLNKMKMLFNNYELQNVNLNKVIRKYNLIYGLFSLLALVITVSFGGYNLYKSLLTYGTLMLFISGTTLIKNECDKILERIPLLSEGYVSLLKIHDFLTNHISDTYTGEVILDEVKTIEFVNVSFGYEVESKVLNNISLKINTKDKVALIGRTGCGKTTLVDILCRFYEINEGKILINGIDYRNYKIESLRDNIGYIMQEVTIFEGNVYENINYGNQKINKEEIIDICKELKLHEKIITLENGYETDLIKNQHLFSLGEKQRLNFARIMIENPSVIILDEVTSSLSYENEEIVKELIRKITKNKISLIIAHRMTTINDCNKVVYLDKGKIIEEDDIAKNKIKL